MDKEFSVEKSHTGITYLEVKEGDKYESIVALLPHEVEELVRVLTTDEFPLGKTITTY